MSQKNKIQMLVVLAVIAAIIYYFNRGADSSLPSVLSADTQFQALGVKEPALRVDLLRQLSRDVDSGSRRNIFVAQPPPPPLSVRVAPPKPFIGPEKPPPPPPPPPLQVPVQFYGYSSSPTNGKRTAFFLDGEEPLVVPEGDTFLGRFRLVKIGNDSADVEEVSTGRRTSLPLTQPADQNSN